MPWKETYGHQEMRKNLIKICNDIIESKKWERKYVETSRRWKTYCNIASEWIAKQVGSDTNWMHYKKDGKLGCTMTANSICRQARKEAEAGNIKQITRDEAQRLAWLGLPVLLCAESKQRNRSGHVAIVYPSPEGADFLVCNIGWDNLICSPGDKRSFGGGMHYLKPWEFYQLKIKLEN